MLLTQCGEYPAHNSSYSFVPRWGYFKKPFLYSELFTNYPDIIAIPYSSSSPLTSTGEFGIIGDPNEFFTIIFDENSWQYVFYFEWVAVPSPSQQLPLVIEDFKKSNHMYFAFGGVVADESSIQLAPLMNGDDLIISVVGGQFPSNNSTKSSSYQVFATCSHEALTYANTGTIPFLPLFGSYCYMQSNTSLAMFQYMEAEIVIDSVQKGIFTLKNFAKKCELSNITAGGYFISIFDITNGALVGKVLQVNPSNLFLVPSASSPLVWASTPAILFYVVSGAFAIFSFIAIVIMCRRSKDGYEPID
jgi:hypothetical protein